MATSGTVATTVIDTAALIEHAFRRAKVPPSQQTPETVQIARENLYFILLNLSNRGLNLWAVEKSFIGLIAGKATYDTPAGTLDVLNVVYSTPTLATVTFAAIAAGGQATISSTTIVRVGFKFSSAFSGDIQVKSSGTLLTTLPTYAYAADQYYWADLPTITTGTVFTVETAAAPYPAVSDIKLVSQLYDLPLSIWNRDTWAALNNKQKQGHPSTNYFFEKKLTPTLTLWPVPDNANDHLMIYRQRQPQDVGTLIQQVEVPQRWYDGIVWLLSAKIGFELPSVPTEHLTLLTQMADKMEFEAEQSETDGAPIYITPGIGAYTK